MPKSKKATTIWVDGWLMFSVLMVLVCLSIRQVRADEDEVIVNESISSSCRSESAQSAYQHGSGPSVAQAPENMDSFQEACVCPAGCTDAPVGTDN